MIKEGSEMLDEKRGPKKYSKPQLVEYGKVEKITQGSISGNPDFGGLQVVK